MKKSLFSLSAAVLFIASTLLTSCQSPEKKVENANEKVAEAKQELTEAQKTAQFEAKKAADAVEWRNVKAEWELKVKENEKELADLKVKMKKEGKKMDAAYKEKVDMLEKQSTALKNRMNDYDKSPSDWESFKREFTHDMEEFGKAFKDLTVDNKK